MTSMAKRASRRRVPGFPVATMAAYGPDNTRATKLVVSVVRRPGDVDTRLIRTWTSDTVDVRSDPAVTAEAAAFISDYGVKRTVDPGRIIGCPHEEGVDYPMGRTCPHCPFWAGIDRFTHEPVGAPAPTIAVDDVLRVLAEDLADQREQALVSADAHREALVGPLLEALDRGVADPLGASRQDASLFSYALYLLAKWREPRAYPHVLRWLSLPEEEPFEIAGDVVTQDGGRILAAVCDGNLEPIVSLILNREADDWGRSAGVIALTLLAAWAEIPRAQIVERLQWLAREGLERTRSAVWDSLAFGAADIEAVELFPELRRGYDEDLIDPHTVSPSELDEIEMMPPGEMTERTRERCPPIDDVAIATAWWDRRPEYRDEEDDLNPYGSDWDEQSGDDMEIIEPYRAPPKVGRNEPCTCGSGKKYKKCCGR